MRLIIALGNPGKQYEKNRHNAGFLILDQIKQENDFPDFQKNARFDAFLCEKTFGDEKIILAKPQGFMNKSGESVKKIMDFYKIPKEDIVVIHDDLDIELGAYKISTNSSAAGHNGVQNIIDKIGSQQFKRIRIGIEGSEKKKDRMIPGEIFVLQNFTPQELETIIKISEKITNEVS